jgi:hypothetical protein
MHIIKTIGKYKVWFYPRKRVYRIAPIDQPLCIIHKDYNSLQEIINYIDADKQSNIVYTDPYNIALQWLKTANKNSDYYKRIDLLIGQYYYGIQAKKELRALLIEMNLISD